MCRCNASTFLHVLFPLTDKDALPGLQAGWDTGCPGRCPGGGGGWGSLGRGSDTAPRVSGGSWPQNMKSRCWKPTRSNRTRELLARCPGRPCFWRAPCLVEWGVVGRAPWPTFLALLVFLGGRSAKPGSKCARSSWCGCRGLTVGSRGTVWSLAMTCPCRVPLLTGTGVPPCSSSQGHGCAPWVGWGEASEGIPGPLWADRPGTLS